MGAAVETGIRFSPIGKRVRALLRLASGSTPKLRDGASKSAAGKFNPSLSHSLEEVAVVVLADGANIIAVNGDAPFFAACKSHFPTATLVWLSISYPDIEAGALSSQSFDYAGVDAVLCGGVEVATRWRQSLQQITHVQSNNPTKSLPAYWVAERWEFCSGMLPIPLQAEDGEAVLFNHFEQFFGIRDPLQFKVTIYHGAEEKHFYRVLEPNQSLLLRLSDYFPSRKASAAFSAHVEHPALTRGRHYRMRLCGDVFWQGSLTTLHSSHEFNRDPQKTEEFRVSSGLLRQGEMVFTIPNYDRNQATNTSVDTINRQQSASVGRDLSAYQQEIALRKSFGEADGFMGCRYAGYGGSFWFAFDRGRGNRASLAANHHVSVPWNDRSGMELSASEASRLKSLQGDGFMIEPHPIPVLPSTDPLRFGFDCDNANPACHDFLLYLFDGTGQHIITHRYHKSHRGPAFAEDFLSSASRGHVEKTKLVMMVPDWLTIGHTRDRYKLLADLVVENRESGDRDVTEFQSSWRNIGMAIPDVPHWLSPANGIIGRTNLVGRVRHGGGFRTGLVLVNGSGSLSYRTLAKLKVVVFNLRGTSIETSVEIPAFTAQTIWLDDIFPALTGHLGSDVGSLVLRSPDADLNCQLLTTNDSASVSLQHLWGY